MRQSRTAGFTLLEMLVVLVIIGLIAGLVFLFKDKKRSMDTVLIISIVLAALATALYFLNPTVQNGMIYPAAPISLLAGLSSVIGLVLVLIVRFVFGKNVDLAAAVTWRFSPRA